MSSLKPLWPGFGFKTHQETGIAWMLEREKDEQVRGGLMCDEMGLGKTIQLIGLIKNGTKRMGEKNLLIAPVAVLEQWKKVAWKTSITIKVPSEKGWVTEGKGGRVGASLHCIGYEAALRKSWLVGGFRWDRLIYDEAHRIASNNTGTDLALRIQAEKKWLLTGTPVVNKLGDLVNLFRVLGVEKIPGPYLQSLKPLIHKYVLARNMDQLRESIPDAPKRAIHIVKSLDFLTEDEEKFYHSKADIIANQLNKMGGGRGAALQRLKLIMRLRQVSLHPQIYNEARKAQLKSNWTQPDWEGNSTKFEAIRELVNEAGSSKWIIFCHFRHEMTMLEEMLKGESRVEIVQQYHGGLSAAQKEDVLERTHMPVAEGKHEVLLVQLQSGGTGLNLQHFDRIIFTGPWWTKALMEQAVGRAVRIGQTKQVVVYHLRLKAEEDSGAPAGPVGALSSEATPPVYDERINIDRFMWNKAEGKGDLCAQVLQTATTAVKPTDLSTY